MYFIFIAQLSPSVIYGCPQQEITFTCNILQGSTLRWNVDFVSPSLPEVQRVFLESSSVGSSFNVPNVEGSTFTITLLSKNPLESTLTTIVVQNLYGAIITCDSLESADYASSSIYNVNGMTFQYCIIVANIYS